MSTLYQENEVEAHDCPWTTFTHRNQTWDTSTIIYEDQGNAMLNYKDAVYILSD